MNLKKLFDAQKVLMDRIEKDHPRQSGENRRNKKIMALYVEVSECANEWRGFKFWSNNQTPRTFESNLIFVNGGIEPKYKNPLLEEYVDGLHFVLELGIDTNIDLSRFYEWEFPEGGDGINEAFLQVFEDIQFFKDLYLYSSLLESYIRLGATLGFSWEEIEEAYYEKNKINIQRQENGY